MFRKGISILLSIMMLCSVAVGASAEEEYHGSAGQTTEVIANPDLSTNTSGSGHTNTGIVNIRVNPDQLLKEQINQMAKTFGDDWESQSQEEQQNSLAVTDTLLNDIQPINLIDFQYNNVNTSQPEQALSHYASPKANGPSTVSIQNNGAIVTVEDFNLPISQLAPMFDLMDDFNNDSYSLGVPITNTLVYNYEPGKTYPTSISGLNESGYMAQFFQEMVNYLNNNGTYLPSPYSPAANYAANLMTQSYLSQIASIKEITGTNIPVICPNKNSYVYDSLMSYIKALRELGASTVHAKKLTVYKARSYHVRTIYKATPVYPLSFRWVVKDINHALISDNSVQGQNYLKVLFESSGTYYVTVYQTKDVTRNNKADGYKSEIWILDNGDAFDGMVFYNHTTRFVDFISNNVGPVQEELQLTHDGFTARITEGQANTVQTLDENGYLRTSGEHFFTERN